MEDVQADTSMLPHSPSMWFGIACVCVCVCVCARSPLDNLPAKVWTMKYASATNVTQGQRSQSNWVPRKLFRFLTTENIERVITYIILKLSQQSYFNLSYYLASCVFWLYYCVITNNVNIHLQKRPGFPLYSLNVNVFFVVENTSASLFLWQNGLDMKQLTTLRPLSTFGTLSCQKMPGRCRAF